MVRSLQRYCSEAVKNCRRVSDFVRDKALVLRTTPFGESSLIITAFTAGHGRIGLMAKGARRKLKIGTALVLERGYELDVVWSHKSARDLQLLREMSLINAHFGIRNSLESIVIANAAVELVLRTTHDDDPHATLYGALSEMLKLLENAVRCRWSLFWKFHLVLLAQLGFAVQDPDQTPQRPFKLSGESLALLRRLDSVSMEAATRLRYSSNAEHEITRWLTHYLSDQLHAPSQPRSFEALRWVRSTYQSSKQNS